MDIITQPIIRVAVALLDFFYSLSGSYGIAIILFTVVVKLALLPLTIQQIRSQVAMTRLQPLIAAVQKKYAKDREKQTQETMRLYQEHGVNPASGCLPLLIQLPLLWLLYAALLEVSHKESFAAPFLWIPNLAQPEPLPYILIIIMIVTQLLYQKMMTTPVTDPQQQATNQMMQFMPIFFAILFINFPSGLVLYWVATNVVSIILQWLIAGPGELGKWLPAPLRFPGFLNVTMSPASVIAAASTDSASPAEEREKEPTPSAEPPPTPSREAGPRPTQFPASPSGHRSPPTSLPPKRRKKS